MNDSLIASYVVQELFVLMIFNFAIRKHVFEIYDFQMKMFTEYLLKQDKSSVLTIVTNCSQLMFMEFISVNKRL